MGVVAEVEASGYRCRMSDPLHAVTAQALALDPGVEHEVDATSEADMLLGVHMITGA